MTTSRIFHRHVWVPALLAISCVVCGCGKHPLSEEMRVVSPARDSEANTLPSVFTDYRAAFQEIARREGLRQDEQALFGLAVDSTVERFGFTRAGVFSIVRPEYYGKSQFGIRGVLGQGNYYVFQRDGAEWRLLGVLQGNSYRWDCVGDKICIITRWHVSAGESPETVYLRNGRTFHPEVPQGKLE